LAISDHVALLLDGQLAFNGTTDEIRGSKDERVQLFLNPVIDPDNPRFRKQENAS
jgi:ABC-type transporter Mla maintaining outer membrane lipid asymmetry ATPase subunit MlaF